MKGNDERNSKPESGKAFLENMWAMFFMRMLRRKSKA